MRTWGRIGTTPIRPPRVCGPLRWQAPPAQPWVFASLPVKAIGRSVEFPLSGRCLRKSRVTMAAETCRLPSGFRRERVDS